MLKALLFVLVMPAIAVTAIQANAQTESSAALAKVTIPTGVLAGGKPLARGTYEIRFSTTQPPAASDAQRRVEFLAGGSVVAQELAEVLRDDDLPSTGDSARPSAQGVRVEMLKGGEFLRISIKRGAERLLIHLAVPPSS